MPSTVHMATIEDDQRHTPGPGSPPLWNESFWFAFYDSRQELGVTVRLGMYPNKQEGNLYLHFVQRGEVVHSLIDLRAPLPAREEGRLGIGGMTVEWEQPLERFRLRYQHAAHALDVAWQGFSPTYLYPAVGPESGETPGAARPTGHIEHAGVVTGTMTIAGTAYAIDCLGHRDHSWGAERDWNKLPKWDYLSGEIGKDFWFNAVRVSLGTPGNVIELFLGGLWDGREVLGLAEAKMDVRTTDGGARQLGVDLHLVDERQREHHIVGEQVLVIAPTQFGRTWCKDGFTRYRYGDRIGYGILEHAYIERNGP